MPAWASFPALFGVFGCPLSGPWFELLRGFVAFPALVFFAAKAKVAGRFRQTCLTVGAIRTAFCLSHAPVIRYIDTALKRFGLTQQDFDAWLVVLAVALSAAITVVMTHIFERTLKRVLAQLVGSPPAFARRP